MRADRGAPRCGYLDYGKDAVKLTNRKKVPEEVQKRLYYVPVRVAFLGDSEHDFIRQLKNMLAQIKIQHPSSGVRLISNRR